jgi:predicted transcriptional regulator
MKKATIRSLTAKGYSQKRIAKTLGIRKMKVVTYQKTHRIGKRVEQPFWKEISFKEARKATYNMPKWARKRAERQGKEYKSFAEFWKEWRAKWRDATQAERDAHGYEATYGEEGEFVGGTPH